MCTQDDLDLVRADEDGMIDRREDEGHPVNTDPPVGPLRHKQRLSTVMCATCAPLYVIHAAEWYPFVAREGEVVQCHCCSTVLGGAIDPQGDATYCPCQYEADSGVEEDTRHRNFNALTVQEEEYMALARSCSDATLRQHCADYGMHSPEAARLRWLGGQCFILARRLETGRGS